MKTWLVPNYWTQHEGWAVNVFNVFVQKEFNEDGSFNERYNKLKTDAARFRFFKDTYQLFPNPAPILTQAIQLVFYLYYSPTTRLNGATQVVHSTTKFANEKYNPDDLQDELELFKAKQDVNRPNQSKAPPLRLRENESINQKIYAFLELKTKEQRKANALLLDPLFELTKDEADFRTRFNHYKNAYEMLLERKRENEKEADVDDFKRFHWKQDFFYLFRAWIHFMKLYSDEADEADMVYVFKLISPFLFKYRVKFDDPFQHSFELENKFDDAFWANPTLAKLKKFGERIIEAERASKKELGVSKKKDKSESVFTVGHKGVLEDKIKKADDTAELCKLIIHFCDILFKYKLTDVLVGINTDRENPGAEDKITTRYPTTPVPADERAARSKLHVLEDARLRARPAVADLFVGKSVEDKQSNEAYIRANANKDGRTERIPGIHNNIDNDPETLRFEEKEQAAAAAKEKSKATAAKSKAKSKAKTAKATAKSPKAAKPKAKTAKANPKAKAKPKASKARAATKSPSKSPKAPKAAADAKLKADFMKKNKEIQSEIKVLHTQLSKLQKNRFGTNSYQIGVLEAKIGVLNKQNIDFEDYKAADAAAQAKAVKDAKNAKEQDLISIQNIKDYRKKNKSDPRIAKKMALLTPEGRAILDAFDASERQKQEKALATKRTQADEKAAAEAHAKYLKTPAGKLEAATKKALADAAVIKAATQQKPPEDIKRVRQQLQQKIDKNEREYNDLYSKIKRTPYLTLMDIQNNKIYENQRKDLKDAIDILKAQMPDAV